MSELNNKPTNNQITPMCPCGKSNCPNPGNRIITREVKGHATEDSNIPKKSGPRYKWMWV